MKKVGMFVLACAMLNFSFGSSNAYAIVAIQQKSAGGSIVDALELNDSEHSIFTKASIVLFCVALLPFCFAKSDSGATLNETDFTDIRQELVDQGLSDQDAATFGTHVVQINSWKLLNPGKTLSDPKANLDSFKAEFKNITGENPTAVELSILAH